MCIIAYSPEKSIEIETLKNCFENNPNGAGIMYKKNFNDDVHIVKGLMTFEDLKKEYNKIPDKSEVAVHCRIATSGAIGAATCHPFPVIASIEKMKKPKMTTDMALMHNGIITFCTPKNGLKETYSDSMLFTKNFIEPLKFRLDKKYIQSLIEESTGSRFCIMRKDKTTILLGTWTEEKGNKFSNTTYQKAINYYNYGNYGRNYLSGYGQYEGFDDGEYEGWNNTMKMKKKSKIKQRWRIELTPPDADLEIAFEERKTLKVAEQEEKITEDMIYAAIDEDIDQIEMSLLENGIQIETTNYKEAPFVTTLIVDGDPTQICEAMTNMLYTEVAVCRQSLLGE